MDRRLWVCLRTRFITTASVSRHLGVQGIMVNHYRPQVKIKGTLPHILQSTCQQAVSFHMILCSILKSEELLFPMAAKLSQKVILHKHPPMTNCVLIKIRLNNEHGTTFLLYLDSNSLNLVCFWYFHTFHSRICIACFMALCLDNPKIPWVVMSCVIIIPTDGKVDWHEHWDWEDWTIT